jgi:hypothetical protein
VELSQHGCNDFQAARPRSLSAPNLMGVGAKVSSSHHSLEDVLGSPAKLSMMNRRSSNKSIASLASIDECSEADTLDDVIFSAQSASASGASDDPFARADLLAQVSALRAPEVTHRPRFRTWTPGHGNKKVVWDRVIGDNSADDTLEVLSESRSENTRLSDEGTEPPPSPVRRDGALDECEGRCSPLSRN